MDQENKVKNLSLLRVLCRLLPLKHKMAFLIKGYLHGNKILLIRYCKNWTIKTRVDDINRRTVEEIILEGMRSQPEYQLIRQLQQTLPGDMVLVDVGGNIGTFFSQFIEKCAHVYVFEPIPRLNTVIKESVAFNRADKVLLIEKAVGDNVAVVKMSDSNNSNILESWDNSVAASVFDIQATTLDIELAAANRIDFIKIDVEGYEMHVLLGAIKTIQKHRPDLLVEVHPDFIQKFRYSAADVIRFLENHNYTIRYYSFLGELRLPRWKRIVDRWLGNQPVRFHTRQDILADMDKEPRLSTYHFYCQPH